MSIPNQNFLPFNSKGSRSFKKSLILSTIGRFASFFYTADGSIAKNQVWDETLRELSFAHVEEIIASMK